MRLVPDAALREFNACHSPVDGKFCAGTGHKTHSEAFQKWFSGSVVVDRKGDPMVLYHGTPSDFMKFTPGGDHAPGKMPSGPAIWLSPDPEHIPAAHHIGGPVYGFRAGTNVIPVYARITKPLRVDDNNVAQTRKDMGLNSSFPLLVTPAEKKRLTSAGYDGVFYTSKYGREVVAFRSTQLKSAIANRGTYSRVSGSLVEANPCHDPDTGQFCSTPGQGSPDESVDELRKPFEALKINVETHTGHGISISGHQWFAQRRQLQTVVNLNAWAPHGSEGPSKLKRVKVVDAALESHLWNRGLGKAMYRLAAAEARKAGWAGIYSLDSSRNAASDRLWASLEKAGLAKRTGKGYEL